jgi:hypothetical protein
LNNINITIVLKYIASSMIVLRRSRDEIHIKKVEPIGTYPPSSTGLDLYLQHGGINLEYLNVLN